MDPEACDRRTTATDCQFGCMGRNAIAVSGATIRHVVSKSYECDL